MILRLQSAMWLSASSPAGGQCPQVSIPAKPGNLQNCSIWVPLVANIPEKSSPLTSQPADFGKYSPCGYPCALCSLSPFSTTRAPSPPQQLQSVSSPNTSLHFLPSLMWSLLSFYLCSLFYQSSGWFLAYSEWFNSYLAMFHGWGKPMVLLLYHHLSSPHQPTLDTQVCRICQVFLCKVQRHFCLVRDFQSVVNWKEEKKGMTHPAIMLTSLLNNH